MRLFISSLFNNIHQVKFETVEKVKYMLESYFYLSKNSKYKQQFLEIMIERNKADYFLLDSGAFSFMNGKEITEQQLDDYCEQYVDFINKYHIKRFVELDVDAIFGYEKALEYRKFIEQKTGRQCIPIWHKSRGIDKFKKLVADYKYIGLGGIAIKVIKKNEYQYFADLNKYAKYYGTKIHAMGFTPSHDIKQYGFYSGDSSSWNAGARFGNVYVFKKDRIVVNKRPANCRINKKYSPLITDKSLSEWVKYQKYVDRLGS